MSQSFWQGFIGTECLEKDERESGGESLLFGKYIMLFLKCFRNMTSLFPDLNFGQHIDMKSIW